MCPLYNKDFSIHCKCESPVCAALEDCGGLLTGGKCTVPAIVWSTIVRNMLKDSEQRKIAIMRKNDINFAKSISHMQE